MYFGFVLIFVFLVAFMGAGLGAREALKQFKQEIIKELLDYKSEAKRTARDVLDKFKSELLQELREGTPQPNSNTFIVNLKGE